MKWQPIETAPKDGTIILGWCSHEADDYFNEDRNRLTNYGCACEAYNHVEDGCNVVFWIEEDTQGSWEEGYYTVPGYWALWDGCGETCANPTHWMPLPQPPEGD